MDPSPVTTLEPVEVRRMIAGTNRENTKTRCIFQGGASILVSNFLASFIRPGDELTFPTVKKDSLGSDSQILIYGPSSGIRRRHLLQATVGYASLPREDKREKLYVSAGVENPSLGISRIHLPCKTLRDYFYVDNRHQGWEQQPSFYALLRVDSTASMAELNLAFKLRCLELRSGKTDAGKIASVERAFNILARPELRACYDSLLAGPESSALFPYGGFGALLVAGELSRDGAVFYASRILSFLPNQKRRQFRAALRKFVFYDHHAIYCDSRRKLELLVDPVSLPLQWDCGWNQWKHLLGAKIGIHATFVHSGTYCRRGPEWQLLQWETSLPSRTEIAMPANIVEEVNETRMAYHRFGQFSEELDQIRERIESAPVEKRELQRLCSRLGIPADLDVSQITWRPDYDPFYYKQLLKRARNLFLFCSEYLFDLDSVVVVETPQLGHATYLFSKPANMIEFLALYARVTKDDIRRNRGNVAERLGFLGRLVHGVNPRAWLKELKTRLGEVIDFAETID